MLAKTTDAFSSRIATAEECIVEHKDWATELPQNLAQRVKRIKTLGEIAKRQRKWI